MGKKKRIPINEKEWLDTASKGMEMFMAAALDGEPCLLQAESAMVEMEKKLDQREQEVNIMISYLENLSLEDRQKLEADPKAMEMERKIYAQRDRIKKMRESLFEDRKELEEIKAQAEFVKEQYAVFSEARQSLEDSSQEDDPETLSDDLTENLYNQLDEIAADLAAQGIPFTPPEKDPIAFLQELHKIAEAKLYGEPSTKKIDRLPVERQLFPLDRVFSELRKPDTIVTAEEKAKDPDKWNPILIPHGPAKQPDKFNDWALFTIDLEGDENVKLKSPDRLTVIESICYSTLFSIIDAGNRGFLLEDLARIIFGKKGGTIKASTLNEIEDALKKLSRIEAEINFTDSMKSRSKKYTDSDGSEITEFHTEGKLLNYKVETYVNRKGNAKRYFRLLDVPDLYTYSKITGRLAALPREVMDVRAISADGSPGAKIPMNIERGIPLQYSLARRVAIMQREANKVRDKYRKQFKSNGQLQKAVTKEKTPEELWKETSGINAPYRILFDSLAEDAELETPKSESAKKKFRHDVREICTNILDYWTAIGFIDGYKIVKRGQSKIGVDIIFKGINDNSNSTRSAKR